MSEDSTAILTPQPAIRSVTGTDAMFVILMSLSVCHLLNDMILSLVPATYPILKQQYHLNFGQMGLITLALQLTASVLQPAVGMVTDRHPRPFALPLAMVSALVGLILLAMARSYVAVLFAAVMLGTCSALFHPEASRVARLASGGRYGFAQSLFQMGGTAGTALGPLLAAFIVVPFGQGSIAWFSVTTLFAIPLLTNASLWYTRHPSIRDRRQSQRTIRSPNDLFRPRIIATFAVLMVLLFSKNIYTASLTSFYVFYLISKFHVSVAGAQVHLFIFLFALAVGTFFGGLIGDRFGRRPVIWFSILGALPFTLMLPYANLWWTGVLSVVIGLILASAFSAILVYAQELLPGRVGLVSGMFFGLAFGLAGLGAAALGRLADVTSIETVYRACSFLPLIGLLTALLPKVETVR